MSKEYRNLCATYNIPLNKDNNDVFRTGCVHLYNFLHCKSTDYKPLMLKMHLEFVDSPLMTEAERTNIEQLEGEIKDALRQSKNDGNQLMDHIDKLEKNNSLDYERINALLSSSDNTPRQSVQQLEDRIKTIEYDLLQRKSDGNKLKDCIETNEKNKAIDKAPGDANNITHDLNASKETHNEHNLSGKQHNDTENVASASKEHHTYTISEEKQEFLDLRSNCVYIRRPKCYWNSLDAAFSYVHALANEMNAQIADNSVIHIDMDGCHNWHVYFRDEDSKREFLKNRFIYKYNRKNRNNLRILDYTDCSIVNIHNFESSDLSLETAFGNVDGLAKKMGITNIKNSIDHIDVYSTEPNILIYSVRFKSQNRKNEFLQKKGILKEFPETCFLKISDVRGHTAKKYDVTNFPMAVASSNVIGIAELMGLSLSTDNVKRIYVLNTKKFTVYLDFVIVSLVVEFSSSDIKNNFLKNIYKLGGVGNTWIVNINISDIITERGNMVSIKYYEQLDYTFTAMSFIGLAKQLGYSLTPDQTVRFLVLSRFISDVSS